MGRVEDAEARRNPGWSQMALDEIRYTARELEYFTSDDVRAFIAAEPESPQAWGPVYRKAMKLGLMEVAPERGKVKSTLKTQHSHRIDWYRSLIFSRGREQT
jgi:hypothetical protein